MAILKLCHHILEQRYGLWHVTGGIHCHQAKMKTKTLLTLPPDPRSIDQAILIIHYRLRLVTKELDVITMEKFGWSVARESEAVTSVWFKDICFQSLITFFTRL